MTKKPAETRMGSGKGNPEGWVAVVRPGRVMFELAGVPEPLAREAMLRAAAQAADQDQVHHAGGGLTMASKAAELRELPDEELYVRIESAKEELFNLRFQLATGQLDNSSRLKDAPPRRGADADGAARTSPRGASSRPSSPASTPRCSRPAGSPRWTTSRQPEAQEEDS